RTPAPLPPLGPPAPAAPDQEHDRREPPWRAEDSFVVAGIDRVALVLHAEEERIEGRQEADDGPSDLRPPQRGQILAKHRADSPTHTDRGQLRLEARPDLAGVRRRHVGPEGEVTHRRRAMRPEIPPEELEFRLLRRQVGPFRKPVLRTNKGCLCTAGRTETREPPKA